MLVIAAGVGAQWLAARLKIPAILLLLAVGILLGPVLELVDPGKLFGDLLEPFVALAVAVVLFEGGMTLNVDEARHVGKTLRRLILSGLILGFALTTVLAHYVGGLSWGTSAVLGAILVVTGPTVILPLLRGARIASRPATLLKWEGIVNDPLGALLALFVLSVVQLPFEHSEVGTKYAVVEQAILFIGTAVAAGVLGAVLGYVLHRALDRGWIAEHIKSPVIFASVLAVFATTGLFGRFGAESGLLAVTVMGMVLTNVSNAHVEDVRRFKEQFSTILVSVLFILLSARLDLLDLKNLIGMPLVLIALIVFVVRPAVGFAATIGSNLPVRERLLLAWIAPRGVVAAAVAGAFAPTLALSYDDAALLEPIVFGVIITTVLLHGLSLGPLARRLGLAHEEGNGILVVGASQWTVALCQHLAKAGATVILADTRYRKVSRARQEGLEVHYGEVLAEEAAMELPMESVSWVLASADDDAYNALVCLRFGPELGREQVLQLSPSVDTGTKEVTAHMMGRNPWGDRATYRKLSSRFWGGGAFKTTSISESYGWVELRDKNPNAMFLFSLTGSGRLQVLTDDSTPPNGSKVIYLTEPTTLPAMAPQTVKVTPAPPLST